jgi:hypothetical protein
VVVPAGTGTLEFIYKPGSLMLGLWLAGLAVIIVFCWLGIAAVNRTRKLAPALEAEGRSAG